jgi:DNA-binding transcriptional ArsR family regulator
VTGATSLDGTFAALSDPTRRAVIDLLVARPRRAGELAEALAMSPPALSRHLRVLRKSGLVVGDEPEDDARVRLYRLQPAGFVSLRDWLAEIASFWGNQLQAFKAHVERTPVRKTPGGNARKRAITTPMRPRR